MDRKAVMSIMSGSNVQEHPYRVWRPSVSAPSLAYLGPGKVSETRSVEDTAIVPETALVEDVGSEEHRSSAMSSTPQISSTVVSAVIVASQVGSAEAFVFNTEADEIAVLTWTIIIGAVGLFLMWSYRWVKKKQTPQDEETLRSSSSP